MSMTHKGSVKELQKVIAPVRAAGWFVRHQLWSLGYYDERGQRVELARGNGQTPRGVEAVYRAAVQRWKEARK